MVQLPALAEMEALVAFEAQDLSGARRRIDVAVKEMGRVRALYATAGPMAQAAEASRRLGELAQRVPSAMDRKRLYSSSRMASKSRPQP